MLISRGFKMDKELKKIHDELLELRMEIYNNLLIIQRLHKNLIEVNKCLSKHLEEEDEAVSEMFGYNGE